MDKIEKIFSFFWDISTVLFIYSLIVTIILAYIFISKKWRLYAILYRNLSKKVCIVLPNNGDEYKMENEIKSINNKIFNLDTSCTSYNNFKNSDNIWLIVVWYKKSCVNIDTFKELLLEIGKKTPIIFYTYWDNQAFDFRDTTTDDFAKYLKNYDNYLVNNFPLKLIWDIFSILSIYKK